MFANAYSGKTQPKIYIGTVKIYTPASKIYTVVLDGIGDRNCRKILTGANKPIPPRSRVVVGLFRGADWIILGEIDSLPPTVDIIPRSYEDQAAEAETEVNTSIGSLDKFLPSFRQIDSEGVAEDPDFAGDVSLENRDERAIRRSKIKIFSFGDILSRASNICFTYLHKKENTILTRARNLITRTFGYTRTVQTPTEGLNAGKTTVSTIISANALTPETIDVQEVRGHLTPNIITVGSGLFGNRVAAKGSRDQIGTFWVSEKDADTGTIRSEIFVDNTEISLQTGLFTAENAVHPFTALRNPQTPAGVLIDGLPVSKGIHAKLGDSFDFAVDLDTNSLALLSLQQPTQRVMITDDAIVLERSGQSFRLDDSGLTIDVFQLNINVGGEYQTTVGGSASLDVSGPYSANASIINLN